ncbi:sigma E protease regulator RseP [Pseudoalteromonas luteoviolacea]|uniref:sigma E protease regulator RseP n=1 Tax=Pseudoalteromonas luteoviolacea TaxID=43657 RepID=UPI001EEF3A82|nr:sigma E protease regulator RseP [Pseudoalteromonas luteoviolacea]MCF6440433.1 sigma E protease regulator RseP [Pseudoalteromonas luteoviolacea]
MFDFFWNLGSFVVALSILVAVHEYGHFWVARKAGVKVLRFSIGFGKPLFTWYDKLGTEYAISAVPLGGYVRMLDSRVDDVSEQDRNKTLDSKSVYARMAVAAAGPLANFIFAVFALAIMYIVGVQNVKPVVGSVAPNSIAHSAGMQSGDLIKRIGDEDVSSWQEVNFAVMSGLGEQRLEIKVTDVNGQIAIRALDVDGWKLDKRDVAPLTSIGITPYRPNITTELAVVAEDSAASRAGVKAGDLIISFNQEKISSWTQFVELVQQSPNKQSTLTVLRNAQEVTLNITPDARETAQGIEIGYLGVVPRQKSWPEGYIETRQYGVFDSILLGVQKTYALTKLSFEMIGNLITGQVSVKNISGPVGIAVGAGDSVSYGLVAFLSFLALISVNLGVFNLLPLPMLDGGHLMYYLIELIRKKPVSEKTQELGYKLGAMMLLALTCFALFNDVSRL